MISEQENIYQSSDAVDASGVRPQDKNSKIGIASFVLLLLGIADGVIVIGYSMYLGATGQGDLEAGEFKVIMLGFGVLLSIVLLMVSFVLGVIGLFQSQHRRTFAILGTSISAVFILVLAGLVWIGINVD